jgi:hypothetical protein
MVCKLYKQDGRVILEVMDEEGNTTKYINYSLMFIFHTIRSIFN